MIDQGRCAGFHFPDGGWLVVEDDEHAGVRGDALHRLDGTERLVGHSERQWEGLRARDQRPSQHDYKQRADRPTQHPLRLQHGGGLERNRFGLRVQDLLQERGSGSLLIRYLQPHGACLRLAGWQPHAGNDRQHSLQTQKRAALQWPVLPPRIRAQAA